MADYTPGQGLYWGAYYVEFVAYEVPDKHLLRIRRLGRELIAPAKQCYAADPSKFSGRPLPRGQQESAHQVAETYRQRSTGDAPSLAS